MEKRKNPYFQDSLLQNKSRFLDDKPYRVSSYQCSPYHRPTSRGGGYSAKPRNSSKNYFSVSSFRTQVVKTNSLDSIRSRFREIPVGGRFNREWQKITQGQKVL